VNERGAPILSVSATAEQPDVVNATVAAVVNSISNELKVNQDAVKVPPESRVTARLLTVSQAYQLAGDKTRVAAAVGAVGIAAIIGAALLAESMAASRTRRRGQRQDAELAALLAYPAGSGSPRPDAAEGAAAAAPPNKRATRATGNGDHTVAVGETFAPEEDDAAPARGRRKGVRRGGRGLAGTPADPPARER